ncbi:unnamed protein product [Orchesella dallaii]|uniref:Uncharacterized protein n=1 Tax=Orchesella dallaii TaxID=48710 RepID=A0ABP1RMQ7_9HEXA
MPRATAQNTVPPASKKPENAVKGRTEEKKKSPSLTPSESESEEKSSNPEPKSKENGGVGKETATTGAAIIEGTDGALPIVPVWIKGPKGTVKSYALLDTGASRSLVEEGLAEELGLDG